MALAGMILGRPPVAIRQSAGRQLLISMLRGMTAYQAAAGYGGAPLAMPALQQFRSPAPRQADPRLVQLYALAPGMRRQQLAQRFGSPPTPTAATVNAR